MRAAFLMVGSADVLSGGYVFNFKMAGSLRDAGHRVDLFHYPTLPAEVRDRPLPTIRHLAGELRRLAPDLLIASRSYRVMLPLALAGVLPRVPLLYLVHHLDWRDQGRSRGPLHRRAVIGHLLRRADAVWANSLSTAKDLADLGIVPERVTIIAPGFDRPDEQPPVRRGRSGPLGMLSVGSLSPRKAQLDLVRACAELGRREFRLVLAGSTADAGYVRAVEREVERLGLRDRVVLTGHLERPELYRRYAEADVLVQPSIWEGYGIAVAEAMWMGLPVVATDGGATPEVVGHAGAGLLLPAGDVRALAESLARLSDDPEARWRMGEAARARAEGLPSWDVSGRRFVELAEKTAAR